MLEPANVSVRLHWEGAAGLLELGVSNLRLNLSPDVLQLALGLQRSVLEPLVQPPPEAPLARCSRFVKVTPLPNLSTACCRVSRSQHEGVCVHLGSWWVLVE